MEKVIKDGKVGVLVSRGYGAGWSTWDSIKGSMFTPDVVNHILEHGSISEEVAKELMPDGFYCGGAEGLYIEWVTVGTHFRIEEYDGNESIEYDGDIEYYEA